MSAAQVIRDYTRVRPAAEGLVLECAVIVWPHPALPELRWVVARTLAAGATEEEQKKARRALLNDAQWFGRCDLCRKWQVRGHMYEPGICQGCAQGMLGVLY